MFLLEAEFTIIACIKCSYLSRCENIDVYNEEMYSLDINTVHGELESVHFVGTPFSMYVYSHILLHDLHVHKFSISKRNKSLKRST